MSGDGEDAVLAAIERLTPLQARLLDSPAARQHLQRRREALGLPTAEAFAERLRSDPQELERVVAAVAVPETWFFRYRQSYEWLRSRLAERAPRGGTLRMLSAPCATGQEPISMAVTALAAGWPAERIVVEAIDASRVAIDRALRSLREPLPLREALPEWASPWLAAGDDGVVADPRVLERIRFAHADLFTWSPPPGVAFDVIFCRNFLIYLRPEARRHALARCGRWLAKDGVLFVGHADHDARAIESFRSVGRPHTFAYERSAGRPPLSPVPSPPRTRIDPPIAARPQSAMPPQRVPSANAARGGAVPAASSGGPPPLPGHLDAIRQLADGGRLDEAASLAERWLRERGPSVDAMELLGCVRLAGGDRDAAWEWFRRVVYLEPGHEAGLLHLAILSEDAGDLAAAARYRERARRANAAAGEGGDG